MFGCGDDAGTTLSATTLSTSQVYGRKTRRSRARGTEEKRGSEAPKDGEWRLSSKVGGGGRAQGQGLRGVLWGTGSCRVNWMLMGRAGCGGSGLRRKKKKKSRRSPPKNSLRTWPAHPYLLGPAPRNGCLSPAVPSPAPRPPAPLVEGPQAKSLWLHLFPHPLRHSE